MRTMLIGLAGYARSGKDTAAQVLAEGGWRRDAFGDRLRAFLLATNPLIPVQYSPGDVSYYRLANLVSAWGWEQAKVMFPEVRALLQRVGTEAGREVLGENVWVDAVLNRYDPSREALVITDVRFPNEAERIGQLGGIVVRICRPGVGPAAAPDGTVHSSETALDDWKFDAEIDNDGDLNILRGQVLQLVRRA